MRLSSCGDCSDEIGGWTLEFERCWKVTELISNEVDKAFERVVYLYQ